MLQAALQVLNDYGLPGFTMEAVARRAGASKTTLYPHWPTSGALLVDAMDATFQPFPVPDTGQLRTDIGALLTATVTMLEHSAFPRLLAAFIDAAERDPALAALHADLTSRRREPVITALARAHERGELPADLDWELVTDLLTGPFFYRRFIAHRPIPTEMVDEVIDHVSHCHQLQARGSPVTRRPGVSGGLMPVVVDPAALLAYAAFPPEIDRDWLGRVCHLSAADLESARRRASAKGHRALGVAEIGGRLHAHSHAWGSMRGFWRPARGQRSARRRRPVIADIRPIPRSL